MYKRFPLLYYQTYFDSWRGSGLLLLLVATGLWVWSPPELAPYRLVLMLAAALGALTIVLGYAVGRLAYVAVGKDGLRIQLPLWWVRIPFDTLSMSRLMPFEQISPSKSASSDLLRERSALVIDLKRWPKPPSWLRFWLGREFVMQNGVVLLVDDWSGLRQAVDAGIAQHRSQRMKNE